MDKKTCFVVCPIGEDGSAERKRSDILLKHFIEPVCTSLNFDVIRVDKINDVDRIDSTIVNYLKTADLVIADMSDHNPNAFYEFGFRQALKLPLIPIIQKGYKIPFDVTTLRTITYVTDDIDKVEDVKNKLNETIKSFNFDNIKKPSTEKAIDVTALLTINDKLDAILEVLNVKNEELIDIVTTQVAKHAQPQISDDAVLLQTLLPAMMSNPQQFEAFLSMAEKFKD
ncbi:hypothetical protein ACMDZ4_002051 [Enterococcus faecalis]|nr:hypothetical protein [Enterococcus faecalis]